MATATLILAGCSHAKSDDAGARMAAANVQSPSLGRAAHRIAPDAKILLDFEDGSGYEAHDMRGKPLAVAERGATRGKRALQAVFGGKNGGVNIVFNRPQDLTTHRKFCFDVTWHTQARSALGFGVVIEDPETKGNWGKNYHNETFTIRPGRNTIRIPAM